MTSTTLVRAILVLTFCSAAAGSAAWRVRMGVLGAELGRTFVATSSAERFKEPATRKDMVASADTFVKLAREVQHEAHGRAGDDALGVLADNLEESANEAAWAVRHGDPEYARSTMRGLAASCFACHSRNNQGVQLPVLDLTEAETSLNVMERAALHAATRRFDQAVSEYSTIIAAPADDDIDAFDREHAGVAALTLAVRTLRDPILATKIADLVLHAPATLPPEKRAALAWKESIAHWANEPKVPASADAKYLRATELLAAASSGMRSAESAVDYLRASTLFHEVLSSSPGASRAAEALRGLGLSYRELDALDGNLVHPAYFEACIRRFPRSELALECLGHYRKSMEVGFSGSGGMSIPRDVADHLSELAKIASP